jgi:two-component system nitrogen regulation sensor histidine kinase GlnL
MSLPGPLLHVPAAVDLETFATPMALLDGALALQAVNPALREWLAGGPRSWRGEPLALLDARPPLLCDAARRAFAEQRRLRLRDARLRTGRGDLPADASLTPLDGGRLLLELQPLATDASAAPNLSGTLRGFAHEVRGPLAGMRGAAQLLQRRVHEGDLVELASLIVAEADRLAGLATRLLAAGEAPRRESTNVHELLDRVAALATREEGGPRVRRDYDPSLPPIPIDAGRVHQAVHNFIRNAGEAGAGEVLLRTRVEHDARLANRRGAALRIDVVDDGPGVPPLIADSLFQPLVSGRADGHGLGLAIAREIAHEHGGEVGHAGRPGATVFSLWLPLAGEAMP